MNGHLAEAFQREAKLFCKESSVWILLSVYGLFLAYGSLQGIVSYRGELEKIARIRGEYSTRWTDIKRKAETAASGPTGAETKEVWGSWRSASLSGSAEGGAVAWITPSTLGALTRGHASREESIRRVSLYENPVRPPLANPINVMYGWMDFGFVVLWLLPVVLMLLAFQAVGRDRELGVWPIVLASGISPRYLILVRLLAPTLMTLGLTFASAALIVVLTSNAFGLAFPLWVLTVTLYGAFWVMLAAWAGLSAKSPVRQQLILGGIWMGAAWIAPGLLEAVMELRIPPVSAIDGVLAAREAQIGVAQRVGPLMHRVYEQNPEWLPASELVTRMNQPVPGGPRRRDARNVYALAGTIAANDA